MSQRTFSLKTQVLALHPRTFEKLVYFIAAADH